MTVFSGKHRTHARDAVQSLVESHGFVARRRRIIARGRKETD